MRVNFKKNIGKIIPLLQREDKSFLINFLVVLRPSSDTYKVGNESYFTSGFWRTRVSCDKISSLLMPTSFATEYSKNRKRNY